MKSPDNQVNMPPTQKRRPPDPLRIKALEFREYIHMKEGGIASEETGCMAASGLVMLADCFADEHETGNLTQFSVIAEELNEKQAAFSAPSRLQDSGFLTRSATWSSPRSQGRSARLRRMRMPRVSCRPKGTASPGTTLTTFPNMR
jgi:hypothetical protein